MRRKKHLFSHFFIRESDGLCFLLLRGESGLIDHQWKDVTWWAPASVRNNAHASELVLLAGEFGVFLRGTCSQSLKPLPSPLLGPLSCKMERMFTHECPCFNQVGVVEISLPRSFRYFKSTCRKGYRKSVS